MARPAKGSNAIRAITEIGGTQQHALPISDKSGSLDGEQLLLDGIEQHGGVGQARKGVHGASLERDAVMPRRSSHPGGYVGAGRDHAVDIGFGQGEGDVSLVHGGLLDDKVQHAGRKHGMRHVPIYANKVCCSQDGCSSNGQWSRKAG